MMSRTFKYILCLFFLTGMDFVNIALAQEDSAAGVINRPQIEYKSAQLRDPFKSYLVKDEKAQGELRQNTGELNQSKAMLDKLIVQGIIWGGKIPQAIINDKVLAVGDSIEGAQILSIDKGGITLNLSGEILSLPSPGQGVISKKVDKEG